MTESRSRSMISPTARGALVGASAALIAFGGVGVAVAATQAGIPESQSPAAPTSQPGVSASQKTSAPTARPSTRAPRPEVVTAKQQQAGLAEAAKSEPVKKAEKEDDKRELSSEASHEDGPAASAPAPAAPVQQAPAPVQSYPVQQAPAPAQSYPVQQAPAPAPAPVQQAPAPAPGLTIDLGGRGVVVPQAPIAPKQLHIG